MSDLEYRVFLKETSDTLGKLTECCKETSEFLKVIELKLKIAEQLYKCSQSQHNELLFLYPDQGTKLTEGRTRKNDVPRAAAVLNKLSVK